MDLAGARLILTVFSYTSFTPARALKRFDSILSGIYDKGPRDWASGSLTLLGLGLEVLDGLVHSKSQNNPDSWHRK